MALIPSESLNFPDNFRASVGWRLPDSLDKKVADSHVGQVPAGHPVPQPEKPGNVPADTSGKSPQSPEATAEAAPPAGTDIDGGQLELIPNTSDESPSVTTDMDAVLNYFLAAGGKPEVSNQQPNGTANVPDENGEPSPKPPGAATSPHQEPESVDVPTEAPNFPEAHAELPISTPVQPPPTQQSIVAALESLAHTDAEAPIGSVDIKTPAQANHILGLIAAAVQRGALVGQTVAEPSAAQVNEPAEGVTTGQPSALSPAIAPAPEPAFAPPPATAPAPEPASAFTPIPAAAPAPAIAFTSPPATAPAPASVFTPPPAAAPPPVTSGFSIASTPVIKPLNETDFFTPPAPVIARPAASDIVRSARPVTESPVKQDVVVPPPPPIVESTPVSVRPSAPIAEPDLTPAEPPMVEPAPIAPVSVRPSAPDVTPVAAPPDPALDHAPAAVESKVPPPVERNVPEDLPRAVKETAPATEKMPAKIRIQPRKKIKPRQEAQPPSDLHPAAPAAVAEDLADIPQKPFTRLALEKKPGTQVATESKSNSSLPARAENLEPRPELSARKIAAARLELAEPDLFLFSSRERRNRWIGFGLSELAVVTALVLLARFGLTHHFPDPTLKVLVFILLLAAAVVAIALPIAFFRNDPRRWQRADQ